MAQTAMQSLLLIKVEISNMMSEICWFKPTSGNGLDALIFTQPDIFLDSQPVYTVNFQVN